MEKDDKRIKRNLPREERFHRFAPNITNLNNGYKELALICKLFIVIPNLGQKVLYTYIKSYQEIHYDQKIYHDRFC